MHALETSNIKMITDVMTAIVTTSTSTNSYTEFFLYCALKLLRVSTHAKYGYNEMLFYYLIYPGITGKNKDFSPICYTSTCYSAVQ
jgi:hypothetical protein